MFLVIIDTHSKWLEVLPVNNVTTAATIEQSLNVFTTHGLPNTIVSYNGSFLQVISSPTLYEHHHTIQLLIARWREKH